MTAFNDFPDEIFQLVLSNLGTSSLRNVVRVTWRLNNLATPILYQQVNVRDNPAQPDVDRRLRRFLRPIITKPDLAPYVQSICLPEDPAPGDAHAPRRSRRKVPKTRKLVADRKLFTAAAWQAGYIETKKGCTLADDNKEAQVILLLYLLPNLRVIFACDLWTSEIFNAWFQSTLRLTHMQLPSGLRNVEKYSVEPRTDYINGETYPTSAEWVIPAMMLPSMRKLDAGYICGEVFKEDYSRFYGKSSIEKLYLAWSQEQIDILEPFFRLPRALKSFTAFLNGPEPVNHLRELCLALATQRQSLRKLSVFDCDHCSSSRKESETHPDLFIGYLLAQFAALETLNISLHCLVAPNAEGDDRLCASIPNGVQVLETEMRGDYEEYCTQLEEIATKPKGIKAVKIAAWPDGKHWRFDTLKKAFGKTDVDLTIEYCPTDDIEYCDECGILHS